MSESEKYGAIRPQVLVAASDVNVGTELALALGEYGVKAPVTSHGEARKALSVTDPCLVVWTAEKMTRAMFALLRALKGVPLVVATPKPVDSSQLPEGTQVVLGSGANAVRRIAAIARQCAQPKAEGEAAGALPPSPHPPETPSAPAPTRPHNPASVPPLARSNPPPPMPGSSPPPTPAKLPPLPQLPASSPPARHQTSRPPPPSGRSAFAAPRAPRVPADLGSAPDLDAALARQPPSNRPPASPSNRPPAPSVRPPASPSVRPPAPPSNRPPPPPSNRPPAPSSVRPPAPSSIRPPAPQPSSIPPPLPQPTPVPAPVAAATQNAIAEVGVAPSPRPNPALMPPSVAPVISSPPPARRRGRIWLFAAAVVLLGGGGVAAWKGTELRQLLTGTPAAATTAEQPAPPASKPPPPKDEKPKKPPREKPSGPYADTLREAPSLESLMPDRGLLPGLSRASEVQLLAMADAADRKQDFETALHFVAHAVKHYPDSPKTRQIHVRVLLHYGDASAALQQADKYLKKESDPELVQLRGDALASLGRLEKAVEVWTDGLDKRGLAQLSGMALNMGRHHAHRANTAETKRWMRRATLLMPDNLEAATGVVEMLLRQKEGKPAVAWAKRVVDKAPKAGFSHGLLGRALLAAGQRDEAIKSLERSVELNPGDGPTVRLLLELRD